MPYPKKLDPSAGRLAAEPSQVHLGVVPESARVISIDVFDTMLVRQCGSPASLYLWLGNQLHQSGVITATPESFARIRLRVEQDVWARKGGLDARVSIRDFYEELQRVFEFDTEDAETLIQRELALEEQVLQPTAQSFALVESAISTGRKVIFVSDTYFPESFIRKQLRCHGLWPDGALCFASTDLGLSKASGKLYKEVTENLSVQPKEIFHLGDNYSSDVRRARQLGLAARWLRAGCLNRYEQNLSNRQWETGGLTAAFAGAARLARMNVPSPTDHSRALCDVAAGVAGPFLVSYVLWLFRRAVAKGLDRLYFVARDGQVLAEIATAVKQKLRASIDVRYLFASRRSLNLAAVYQTTEFNLEWAFRNSVGQPASVLLARLGLDIKTIAPELGSIGLHGMEDATPLTPGMLKTLKKAAVNGPISPKILDAAHSKREGAISYLRQEGLFDGKPFGVVDLGGMGSQAHALYEICRMNGSGQVAFFFLGLDRSSAGAEAEQGKESNWLLASESYLFDERREQGIPPFRGLRTCFQMFCAADHGTVIGYTQNERRVAPVLASQDDQELRSWGLPLFRRTLAEFVDHLALDPDSIDLNGDARRAICENIRMFFKNPTHAESKAWGVFPFEDGAVDCNSRKDLAEPYTWWQVLRAAIDGSIMRRSFPDRSWQSWHEASLLRTEPALRLMLQSAETVFRRLRRLR